MAKSQSVNNCGANETTKTELSNGIEVEHGPEGMSQTESRRRRRRSIVPSRYMESAATNDSSKLRINGTDFGSKSPHRSASTCRSSLKDDFHKGHVSSTSSTPRIILKNKGSGHFNPELSTIDGSISSEDSSMPKVEPGVSKRDDGKERKDPSRHDFHAWDFTNSMDRCIVETQYLCSNYLAEKAKKLLELKNEQELATLHGLYEANRPLCNLLDVLNRKVIDRKLSQQKHQCVRSFDLLESTETLLGQITAGVQQIKVSVENVLNKLRVSHIDLPLEELKLVDLLMEVIDITKAILKVKTETDVLLPELGGGCSELAEDEYEKRILQNCLKLMNDYSKQLSVLLQQESLVRRSQDSELNRLLYNW